MPTVYECAKDHGAVIENWCSDLYIKFDPDIWKVLCDECPDGLRNAQHFTSHDGTRWIDVPFGYDPYWEARR